MAQTDITVGIYTDLNGVPDQLVPHSEVVNPSVPNTGFFNSEWMEIIYGNPKPQLVEGRKYWIKMTAPDAYCHAGQPEGTGWVVLTGGYYSLGDPLYQGIICSPPPGSEWSNGFETGDDFQFFILMDDNSYQMTKNTYYGIEPGTIQTSFDLAPSFAIYKKIKNCIEDMFNTHNGVDMSIDVVIDPDTNIMRRVLNVYYPKQGVDNTGLNFSYPGNLKKLELPVDGKTMMNEVNMRGQGSGLDQVVIKEFDIDSIYTYGLRSDIEQDPDIDNDELLSSIGQEYIRLRKNNLMLPKVTVDGNQPPFISQYDIGDYIQLRVNGVPIFPPSIVFRIEELHVTISDDDMEEVNITLSQA